MNENGQLDWVSIEDHRASLRRARALAAEEIGISELAHQLGENPSTIRNQLARREGKRESGDLCDLIWLLSPDYRSKAAGLCGEVLSKTGDLSPEEALRLIVAKACSSFDKRALADVQEIVHRVRRES